MFFRNIFRFWAEELGNLAEKCWQGSQNHIHWVRRNTFTATFLKKVCKHFNLFGLSVKFPWQQRKIKIRADKTAKNVSRSKLRKNLLQKKKNTNLFFSSFKATFTYIFREKLRAWLSKLQPTYLSKILRFNNFWKLHNVQTSDFEMKKVRTLVEKVCSGFLQQDITPPEE